MMQTLNNLATNNWPTMVGVAVVVFAFGITMAAKFDSKWGYLIAAIGGALGVYVLMANGIFSI